MAMRRPGHHHHHHRHAAATSGDGDRRLAAGNGAVSARARRRPSGSSRLIAAAALLILGIVLPPPPPPSRHLAASAFLPPPPPLSSRSMIRQTGVTTTGTLPPPRHWRGPVAITPPLPAASASAPTSTSSESATASAAPGPSSTSIAKSSSSSSSSSSQRPFADFDWTAHWYPVIWAADLPPNRPTPVTLFDVDYVVARLPPKNPLTKKQFDAATPRERDESHGEIIAMRDVCPHKLAALSEGRVTASGEFQCAYHGWTFDAREASGGRGRCTSIPQVESPPPEGSRSDGRAVPATVSQGMVWLFPGADGDGGGLEDGVLERPGPPRIPELDMEGFRAVGQVRDFPVDWSILLENIMDPDHGLFAHQMPAFDLYSASRTEPQTIDEHTTDGGRGWTVTSTVDAVEKLRRRDRQSKGEKEKGQPATMPKRATTTFVAPSLVYMGRRDAETNRTNFVSAFFVSPVGTGKSRFFAAAVSNIPRWVPNPRWVSSVALLNFLDQDTYLLATQQRRVLEAEAEAITELETDGNDDANAVLPVRKKNYAYRSPTEKLGVRLGAFFDATLGRAPNRRDALRGTAAGGERDSGDGNRGWDERWWSHKPDRRVVLDRYAQHTAICPYSAGVVRKCEVIRRMGRIAAAAVILSKLLASSSSAARAAVGSALLPSWAAGNGLLVRWIGAWRGVSGGTVAAIVAISLVASQLADKLRREYYFKYEEKYRDRDMDKVPSVWSD